MAAIVNKVRTWKEEPNLPAATNSDFKVNPISNEKTGKGSEGDATVTD